MFGTLARPSALGTVTPRFSSSSGPFAADASLASGNRRRQRRSSTVPGRWSRLSGRPPAILGMVAWLVLGGQVGRACWFYVIV